MHEILLSGGLHISFDSTQYSVNSTIMLLPSDVENWMGL